MYSASRSSNAYQLDIPIETPRVKKQQNKKVEKKKAMQKMHFVLYVITFCVVGLSLCFRCVQIYGLHDTIETKTAELGKVRMENEQTQIAINSMIDNSKIEEYAINNLGLQKVENRQIVYLRPEQGDNMQKMAKNSTKTATKGIFGMFSGVLEYLK